MNIQDWMTKYGVDRVTVDSAEEITFYFENSDEPWGPREFVTGAPIMQDLESILYAETIENAYPRTGKVLERHMWFMMRLRQRVRCSYLLGHFSKWRLGDGAGCPWCGICRRVPLMQRLIPYSWGSS